MKIDNLGKPRVGFVSHMRELSMLEDEVRDYFHFKSKCWRAIKQHVCEVETCLLIRHPKDYFIPTHRGTGHAVSFKNAYLYVLKETEVYCLQFAVNYVHKEERYNHWLNETEKKYSIQVPIALEENFTVEAFNAWVKKVGAKVEQEDRAEAIKTIAELKKRFPDLF